jgi:hypothetical protein
MSFLSNEELNELKQDAHKCITILNGYINYLQKAKINGNTTNNK